MCWGADGQLRYLGRADVFAALPQRLPDIAAVEVQLKRMGAGTKLSGDRTRWRSRRGMVGSIVEFTVRSRGSGSQPGGLGDYFRVEQLPELRRHRHTASPA